jgi:carbonic anhydrase
MLLTCIDPRFPEPTTKYMEGRHMAGKYSQFSIAGASIGVVAPKFKTWAPAFWDNLAAAIELHNIPKVIAMNHRDCGAAKVAYGADKVANATIETATHKAALLEFRKQVGERQPNLTTELGLMALDGKVEMFFRRIESPRVRRSAPARRRSCRWCFARHRPPRTSRSAGPSPGRAAPGRAC